MSDQPKSRIEGGESPHFICGAVARSIIHRNYLDFRAGLRQSRFKCRPYISLSVERRDDDGHLRRFHFKDLFIPNPPREGREGPYSAGQRALLVKEIYNV